MLRRFEALLDPTARSPEPPPTDGLWPFYWQFIRQVRPARRRAVHLRRPDCDAGRHHPRLHRPRRRPGFHPHPRRPAARDLAAASLHGRGDAAGPPADAVGPRRADQPDRQPRHVQHGPLAEPLARGTAELDILPERFRRPHRQPSDADRPITSRKPGDGIRRRVVHRGVRQQRAGLARLGRLAPDPADPAVVRRLRRHPALLRASPARTLPRRLRNALDDDRPSGGQLHQYTDSQTVLARPGRRRLRARIDRSAHQRLPRSDADDHRLYRAARGDERHADRRPPPAWRSGNGVSAGSR